MNLNDLNKVELLAEDKKLKDTLQVINSEILNYISKRTEIKNYIMEYRKNFVEEYKDDDDLVAEYFDHERYVKEEAFKTIDRRLKELTILKNSPYFGSINYIEKDEDYLENIYIGRFGLTPEGTIDSLIVDWRAPVSSLFYKGTVGETSYKAPCGNIDVDILKRRQYIIKKEKLQGMFDSATNITDDILQMVLSQNSNEKLKDIVTSIQKEQDEIIRKDRNKTIVVNGVAGSGKTTIALHRVAYLLYNYRKQLDDKVLILGPNNIFMEYISQVLPSLGEVGVRQESFIEFALNIIKEDLNIMDFASYMEKVLLGDKEFLDTVKLKRSNEYIKNLNSLIENMDKEYFKIKPLNYFNNEIVSKEEIEELFYKHYAYMPLFKRSEKIKRILISKLKDKRDEKVRELNKEIKLYKKSLPKEQLVIEENDIEFRRKLKIREIVREVMNSKNDLEEWITNESIINLYNKFNENKTLTVDDLAPILYLMVTLEEKKVSEDLKHIVIDEAQDYSDIQFKVIKMLTGCNNFTIVGDQNQRLINFNEKPAMLNLSSILSQDVEIIELNKSYRSTFEIMSYANKFLKEDKIIPIVRNGNKVDELETNDFDKHIENIINTIFDYQKNDLDNIAIITRNIEQTDILYKKLKEKINIVKFTSEQIIYNGGVLIIPSYFAKGLEFDGVIISEIESEKENHYEEDLVKYIMATRALHSLKVVKYNEK